MCIAEFLEWTRFSGLLYTVPYWHMIIVQLKKTSTWITKWKTQVAYKHSIVASVRLLHRLGNASQSWTQHSRQPEEQAVLSRINIIFQFDQRMQRFANLNEDYFIFKHWLNRKAVVFWLTSNVFQRNSYLSCNVPHPTHLNRRNNHRRLTLHRYKQSCIEIHLHNNCHLS